MRDYQPLSAENVDRAPAIVPVPLHNRSLLYSECGTFNDYCNTNHEAQRDTRSSGYRPPDPFVHNHPKTFESGRKHYKPFALQWPFLSTLIVSLLTLLGLLAYGLCALPRENLVDGLLDSLDGVTGRRCTQDATRVATNRALWATTVTTESETTSPGDLDASGTTDDKMNTTNFNFFGFITTSATDTITSETETIPAVSGAFGITETIVTQKTTMGSSDGSTSAVDAIGVAGTIVFSTDTSGMSTCVVVSEEFGVIGTMITSTLTPTNITITG